MKATRFVLSLLLLLLFLLPACRRSQPEQAPAPTLDTLLHSAEKTDEGYAFPDLPWLTERSAVMEILGFAEGDLETDYTDSQSTLTKRLPASGMEAEVRFFDTWDEDGRLIAAGFFLYFDSEEAALACYNDLQSTYETAFAGEDIASEPGRSFQVQPPLTDGTDTDARRLMTQLILQYLGSTAATSFDTEDAGYAIRLSLQMDLGALSR